MEEWYYSKGDQQIGPVSQQQLRGLAQTGQLSGTDYVWKEGMADWYEARKIPGLSFAGGAAPAPQQGPEPYSAASDPNAASYSQPPTAGYAPPAASGFVGYAGPSREGLVATGRSLEMLRQTKPWVRLISVIMLVGVGLMVVVGLFGLVGMVGASTQVRGGTAMAGAGLAYALFMLCFSLLYLMPAIFLGRYASNIGTLLNSHQPADLEAALQAQKSFWKFIGILTTIILCIYAFVFLIMMVRLGSAFLR